MRGVQQLATTFGIFLHADLVMKSFLCHYPASGDSKGNIADSEQSSHIPGGSRKTSGNMKQKETDSQLNHTTSNHKHQYEISKSLLK